MKSLFGQLIIGPPGSGKTTYCWKMRDHLKKSGRKVVTVNLDPANDEAPFAPDVDIRTLIDARDVMEELNLGPNGALVHCMEYLEKNIDWLLDGLASHGDKCYFLMDAPGQVELYTHHSSLCRIVDALRERGRIRLCAVHLIDSHHCSDAGKFVSALTLSLMAMLRSGLPHVNALSKMDELRARADDLSFGLDFYTDVLDLDYLLETLDGDPLMAKYKRLNAALTSVVQDYSLVSFATLDAHNEASLARIKSLADKANGFGFGVDETKSIDSMLSCAMGMRDGSDRQYFE